MIKIRWTFILDFDSYSWVGFFCSAMPLWFPPQMAKLWTNSPDSHVTGMSCWNLTSHRTDISYSKWCCESLFEPRWVHTWKNSGEPVWYIIFHEQHDFSISVGWDPLRWIDWFRIGVLTSLQKGTWIQGPIAIHFWKPGFFWFVLFFFGSGFC